jgi:type IX secretion system PorP/SprF family membrane protein
MSINKSIIAIISLLLTSGAAFSQQEAMYSQWVYNKQQINPGYTGSKEAVSITALHRSQWVGFKGAPMTDLVSFEAPTQTDELALGGSLMYDKIGPSNEASLSLDVAYRLRLRNRATLSFGGKGTLGLFQANLVDVDLTSDYYGEEDELYMYNPKAVFLPNVGFGAYYYNDDYYISLSSPKMIRNKLERKNSLMYELLEGRTEPTIYLAGGYNFKINREFKLQPNLMAKGTINAPMSIGAYVAVIYMDELTAGLFYNFKEMAGLIVQWQFDPKWKIGYSGDVATSELIGTNYGSHELMVNYSFSGRRKRIVYPRYF